MARGTDGSLLWCARPLSLEAVCLISEVRSNFGIDVATKQAAGGFGGWRVPIALVGNIRVNN